MTAADAINLTDEELAHVWRVMHPRTLQAQCGLSDRVLQMLIVRVSRLRKRGWDIRKWEGGCRYTPETAGGKR